MTASAIPTYTPTDDEEMQALGKADLKEIAGGRASKRKTRAQAELDRRVKNAPYKAYKKGLKATG